MRRPKRRRNKDRQSFDLVLLERVIPHESTKAFCTMSLHI
jgi:hypothetical protein